MPLSLDQWHERLDGHFRKLADARGSGLPIFALEHSLQAAEIVDLSSQLRAHLASGERLGRYWLPWVIYATEIGYRYTGDEYWPSFEEQTVGWELHHRYSLRDWFRKFQSTYHGVEPSGPWAEQFSLIAWPITHAMLPKLLQHQFAFLIYHLRYQLAGLNNLDSLAAGRLLAGHADQTSTRFQQFLQQEELTGRILLGLLGLSPKGGPEPIHPSTLQRIVGDLDGVRTTRAWLKGVRAVVDKFRGIGQGSGVDVGPTSKDSTRERDFALPSQHSIRPNVLLRHSGEGRWTVALDIPSLAPIATLRPDLRDFLKETRCRVAGTADVKPAGWLLAQNRVAVLRSWPSREDPLLVFEKRHAFLDHLISTECMLSRGPPWLFRVNSDGIAMEIVGLTVRPDSQYIVLSDGDALPIYPLAQPCNVDCPNIRALKLSMPEYISAELMHWLNDIGLQVSRSIRVWPAGLPCRGWDGEGESEWLTTEQPCFGFIHDHPVSAYSIQLNGVNQGIVDAPSEGAPIFVQLHSLTAGRYRLNISAHRHGSISDIAQRLPPRGFVNLLVREPQPWVPGIPAHSGLVVTVDPHDASLDEFWENKLQLSVSGPESHSVDCFVGLERGDGTEVFARQVVARAALPLRAETWRKMFATFLSEQEEAANWRFPEATVGRLTIRASELGQYSIPFHRNLQPVRWLTRKQGSGFRLKLLDDTGLDGDAECTSFAMLNPVAAIVRSAPETLAGFGVDYPGMLLVARHGRHQDALVVSDGLVRHGLQSLGVNPNVSDVDSGRASVARAIKILSLWLQARLVGPLAEIRRKQVTTKLLNAIYARLCGSQWASAERVFVENTASPSSINSLLYKVHALGGFAVVIKKDHARLLEDITRSTMWYAELARRFKVCGDSALSEFAVRLAICPHSLPQRFGDDLDKLTKQAVSKPELIRGARFAALLCHALAPTEMEQFSRRQRWR